MSLPHPIDMLVNVTEIDGRRLIIFDSYYPDHGRITNAHYWKRFAGRVCLGEGIVEYVWTPTDIVNTLLAFGFDICGLWEPKYRGVRGPCTFQNPPQNLAGATGIANKACEKAKHEIGVVQNLSNVASKKIVLKHKLKA